MAANTPCAHCGAVPADLFANDGAAVCDRCFAYDKVVAGELRVQQHKYGMQETGDATTLIEASKRAGRNEMITAVVFLLAAAFVLVYFRGHEVSYFIGGILALIGLIVGGGAISTMRFAKNQAPEIVRRASTAPPPPMSPSDARAPMEDD